VSTNVQAITGRGALTALVASICRDVVIEARPDKVGAALRDWGALHTDHTRLRQRR
jgi:hypothetical protein